MRPCGAQHALLCKGLTTAPHARPRIVLNKMSAAQQYWAVLRRLPGHQDCMLPSGITASNAAVPCKVVATGSVEEEWSDCVGNYGAGCSHKSTLTCRQSTGCAASKCTKKHICPAHSAVPRPEHCQGDRTAHSAGKSHTSTCAVDTCWPQPC